MVESLSEDYIRTARAKGLKPADGDVTSTRCAPRWCRWSRSSASTSRSCSAGTVFTETIFDIEGIGKWGLDATYIKDLPVVQATVLVLAISSS